MSRLLESYNKFLGVRKMTRGSQLLEYTTGHQPKRLPPVPQDVKRQYSSLPPRERREVEDEVAETWSWLHTGVIALTTLASAGAIYLAISQQMKKIKTEGEGIKKEIEQQEHAKDERMDKERFRKIMGHAHAINAAYHRAHGLADKLINDDHKAEVWEQLGKIKDRMDGLNNEVKKYILTREDISLSIAEGYIDVVLKLADLSDEKYEAISLAFKHMYHDVKKEVKAHHKMAKKLQDAGKKLKIPATASELSGSHFPENSTTGDLVRQITTKLTLDTEKLALLSPEDAQRLEPEWFRHMKEGQRLIAAIRAEGPPDTNLYDFFRGGGSTVNQLSLYATSDKKREDEVTKALKESAESGVHSQIWGRPRARHIPGQMAEFL